jgi:chorismate mutase/prephenate dehydratase
MEIAELKRSRNEGFYFPEREKNILKRLQALNKGPFPNDALKIIFKEIFSASLSLEKPIDVACLGPLATFTHLAGMRHFGSSAHFIPVDSIRDVFETVESSKADFGIVPIENSNEGVVSYTLDMFMDFDLKITAEVMLEVAHNLLSLSGDIRKVKKIYSHPQATAQCRQWIEKNLPDVQLFESTSTAKAAELASEEPSSAAIASELAAKIYNLNFVERNIEDNKQNFTRFLIISRNSVPKTGRDKTSVMFAIKNRPGALYDILSPFKRAKINLTKIESRPSRRKAWEYIFFVDMEGHDDDKKIKNAIERVKEACLYLKVLGSYPLGD